MDRGADDFDVEHVVAACRNGSEEAWRMLAERFTPLVYAVARRTGLSEAASDDVTQTVFATLVRRIDAIDDPVALPRWLTVATQRACWRHLRSERARRERESNRQTDRRGPDEEASMLEVAAAKELRAEYVRAAMQRIGARCRKLLTVLFSDPGGRAGTAYTAAAQTLKMPVGSIGPTRARCLNRLADELSSDPNAAVELGFDRVPGDD